jgi:hypothetical protein
MIAKMDVLSICAKVFVLLIDENEGKVMNELLHQNQYELVVYCGDGRNDYCPGTYLKRYFLVSY